MGLIKPHVVCFAALLSFAGNLLTVDRLDAVDQSSEMGDSTDAMSGKTQALSRELIEGKHDLTFFHVERLKHTDPGDSKWPKYLKKVKERLREKQQAENLRQALKGLIEKTEKDCQKLNRRINDRALFENDTKMLNDEMSEVKKEIQGLFVRETLLNEEYRRVQEQNPDDRESIGRVESEIKKITEKNQALKDKKDGIEMKLNNLRGGAPDSEGESLADLEKRRRAKEKLRNDLKSKYEALLWWQESDVVHDVQENDRSEMTPPSDEKKDNTAAEKNGGVVVTPPRKPILVVPQSATQKIEKKPQSSEVIREQSHSKGTLYRVERGDTLMTLAAKLYGSPDKWKILYEANSNAIQKGLLTPGQWLFIP